MPTRKHHSKSRNKPQKHHRSLQENTNHEDGCSRGHLLSSVFVPMHSSSSRRSCGLRNLACTSAPDVYVPTTAASVVRASADWEVKRTRCKRTQGSARGTGSVNFRNSAVLGTSSSSSSSSTGHVRAGKKKMAVVVQPGLGCSGRWALTTDLATVECFVPTEHVSISRRPTTLKNCRNGNGDGGRITEEHSCHRARRFDGVAQQGLDPVTGPFASETMQSAIVVLQRRGVRNVQGSGNTAAGDLSQELLIRLSGLQIYDQFRDWRLDVDNMSYEELVELGDRIGYVKTGLREEEITGCLDKLNCLIMERQGKCSICQEEYKEVGEVGKLECGHYYHVNCIRDWLLHKSVCPLCKTSVAKSVPS